MAGTRLTMVTTALMGGVSFGTIPGLRAAGFSCGNLPAIAALKALQAGLRSSAGQLPFLK